MTQPSEQSNRDSQNVDASGSNNIQYFTQSGNIIIYGKNAESEIQLTTEELKDAVVEFLKDVEKKFKYIKLFHAPQETVELTNQYIPIQVTSDRRYERKLDEKLESYKEAEEELKRIYAAKGEKFERQQEDWKTAKKDHSIIMVLADPGMGKSTLLKSEAVQLARQEINKLNDTKELTEEVILNIIESLQFPLFLRLSDLIEESGEVIENVINIIKRRYPGSAEKIEFLLRDKLEKGQCLLLLDALDEVAKGERSTLQRDLNPFINKFENKTICTSRIVGYSSFLNKGKEMEIVPFTEKQTEEYINVWFDNAKAANVIEDDSVSAKGLINEIKGKPQIQGLTQNPLLLSLVCSLYQTKGLELPARKTQVYDKAVNYMLSQWSADNQRLINDDGWVDSKRELLEYLAYQFSCKQTEVFKTRQLRKEIDRFKKETDNSDFKDKNASELLKELSEQDGILQKLSEREDQYLFLHRTFQEYLTASYINEKIEEDEEKGIRLVKKKLWQFDWHETISLVAGLMSDPIPLLEMIRQEEDDMFNTLLLLSGSCLGECGKISDPLVTDIVEKIIEFWRRYPQADFITSILVTLGKIGNEKAVELLITALGDANDSVRYNSADALGKIGNEQAVESLINALGDSDQDIRCTATRFLGEIGNEKAVESLINALNNSDKRVGILTASALAKIANEEAVKALVNALCDSSSEKWVQMIAAMVLGSIRNEQAVKALVIALKDYHFLVRLHAVKALRKIGNEQAIEALHNALNDSNSAVRGDVIEELEKRKNQQTAQTLSKVFSNSDYFIKPSEVKALFNVLDNSNYLQFSKAKLEQKRKNQQTVETVRKALNDPKFFVSKVDEVEALEKIGSEKGVKVLIKALNTADVYLKSSAAEALRKIDYPDTLNKLLNNPSIDIYDPYIFQLARSLMIRHSDKIEHPVVRSQE